MKKLTTSVLAIVLSSSFAVVSAQTVRDTANTTDIEGVVVTALGIKREKKSLGYASQEVSAQALTAGTTNTGNIATQLSGKVAGLQVTNTTNFGGSSTLVIRGYKSLNGGQALIVIDGVPVNNGTAARTGRSQTYDYGNFLADINPNDVESVNVLKGAAASALYGERALNGVIVITTKKGKGKDDKWGVTLSSEASFGTVDKSTFPKYQSDFGAGYLGESWDYGDAPDGLHYVNYGDDASWGPAFNPNLLVYQWDSFDPSSPNYKKATPWVAAKNGPISFFETATTFSNSVNLEKSNGTSSFMLNYANQLTTGIVPNSNLRKNSISTRFSYKLTDKLTANVYSALNIQNTVGRLGTGYSSGPMSGFRQWWQTNVDVQDLKAAYFRTGRNVSWNNNSSTRAPLYWSNPYYQVYKNYESDDRTRYFGWASLDYKINNNLGLMGRVSHDTYNMVIENRLESGTRSETFGNSGATTSSGYEKTLISSSETNYDLILNYKYNLAEDFIISGIVGGNVRRNKFSSTYNSTEPGTTKDSNLNAFIGLTIPGLFSLANSNGNVRPAVEDERTWSTYGGFAQATFSYKDTYFLDGTYRADKSSNLNPDNNTYGYPAVSASIVLSQLLKQDWLSFAKIRGNYAEVGGSTGNYNLRNTYTSRPTFNGVPLYTAATVGKNYDLKPERSKEFEVGLEAAFFKNRLGFDIAAYKTRTINQIIPISVSTSSGYLNSYINAGEIDNKGIEVNLNVTPIKTTDFSWDVNFNWAKNQNKVVDLIDGIDNILLQSQIYGAFGATIQAYKGEAYGTFFGTTWALDPNGNRIVDAVKDDTGNLLGYKYRITQTTNNPIGNMTPDWTGSVRTQFSYKSFSLGFLIDVQKGGQVYSYDMATGLDTGLYAETGGNFRSQVRTVSGVIENPNGSFTQVTGNMYNDGTTATGAGGYETNPDSAFLYDASYVKLREANISYSLPKSVLSSTFINDAKISIVGRNLWIIHKNLPYADPEAGLGNGLSSRGISHGSLPTQREIGVNVTFKF